MKRLSLAAALAAFFCFALTSAALAAEAEEILTKAWTAYNIGQYKETVRLVQPLAQDGNARAQVILGRCYENGLGLPQDAATAAQWYLLAAEANDSEAQVLLAYCFELGSGVPRDVRATVGWMTRAANAGNAEARFNLALYYSQGAYSLPKDQAESFRWAKLAADQGYAQAQRLVGACYEFGIGVEKDPVEAALWYNKAAAQGLAREGNVFNTIREYTLP